MIINLFFLEFSLNSSYLHFRLSVVVRIHDPAPEAVVAVDQGDLLVDHFLVLPPPNVHARDLHEGVSLDLRPDVRFHARDPDLRVRLHFKDFFLH